VAANVHCQTMITGFSSFTL